MSKFRIQFNTKQITSCVTNGVFLNPQKLLPNDKYFCHLVAFPETKPNPICRFANKLPAGVPPAGEGAPEEDKHNPGEGEAAG